jgi:hypothetical protein
MTIASFAAAVRASRLRAWFVAVRGFVGKLPLSLFLLAMRVGVGMEFFHSGLLKLRTWEPTNTACRCSTPKSPPGSRRFAN